MKYLITDLLESLRRIGVIISRRRECSQKARNSLLAVEIRTAITSAVSRLLFIYDALK